MNTWRAYFQINGEDVSYFPIIEFEVPDALYQKVIAAVKSLKPLVECEFYHELQALADDALDLSEYCAGEADELDKPDPDDYDDEDEYQEALDEYEEEYSDLMDSLCVERCVIDDPGDLTRLLQQFAGKVFPLWAGESEVELEYEDDYGDTRYYLTVHVDEKGTVTDITGVSGSSLESESCNSSSWGDCYPDYDLIAEKLLEEFDDQNVESEDEE